MLRDTFFVPRLTSHGPLQRFQMERDTFLLTREEESGARGTSLLPRESECVPRASALIPHPFPLCPIHHALSSTRSTALIAISNACSGSGRVYESTPRRQKARTSNGIE